MNSSPRKRVSRAFVPTGLALLVIMTGCAAPSTRERATMAPATWPDLEAGPDERWWRIVEEESMLLIRVDPAGAMSRLGHSHVIGGAVISGAIITGDDPLSVRADLEIEVETLEVDRPEWRNMFGLEPELDAEAVSGTRDNLLGERVLDARNFASIGIRTVGASGPAWMPRVTARIRLRDQVRETGLPVALFRGGERLEAIGRFEFTHADFGLEPFTAAGGALRVADPIRVRFRIVARPAGR